MAALKRKEEGYIVIETVGAFIPFVLLVVSILSLVNIITMQVRIHYALTQTAGTLSMYCYVLQAAGIADEIATMDGRANSFQNTMDDVMSGIRSLSGGGADLSETGRMLDAADTIAGDPVDMIRNLANYGLNELRNAVSAEFAEPLFSRYLTNGSISAREYLQSRRVTEFAITDCVIIDRNGNIKMTAEYEIEYTFGVLTLPFSPTLRISQTVATKAWLGGSGEGYRE